MASKQSKQFKVDNKHCIKKGLVAVAVSRYSTK